MLLISCPQVTLSPVLQILFFILVVSNLANGFDTQILDTRDDSLAGRGPVRRLAAAHKRNAIQSRDTEHFLRHDHELYYLEGQSTEQALDFLRTLFAHTVDPAITYSASYIGLKPSAESLDGLAAPFSASVRMSAKRPTLALEALEHHIEQIKCSDDKIFLDFATLEALNEVHRHVDGANDFYIITSHESCELEGERNVRRYVCPRDLRTLVF